MTAPTANATVTVYSKDHCPQCDQTIKALDRLGVAYEVVDLAADPAALDKVREMGYSAAPVVVSGDQQWSGFRPAMIKGLAA